MISLQELKKKSLYLELVVCPVLFERNFWSVIFFLKNDSNLYEVNPIVWFN